MPGTHTKIMEMPILHPVEASLCRNREISPRHPHSRCCTGALSLDSALIMPRKGHVIGKVDAKYASSTFWVAEHTTDQRLGSRPRTREAQSHVSQIQLGRWSKCSPVEIAVSEESRMVGSIRGQRFIRDISGQI